MQLPKFVVSLTSGGLDSVVLLYDLLDQGCKVYPICFEYGQRHFRQEYKCAQWHTDKLELPLRLIQMPQLLGSELTGSLGTFVVPNRNAILLSIAVNFAQSIGADCVTFAANSDDEAGFPDCRKAFVANYNIVMKLAEVPIEICAPYIDKSKKWIVQRGHELKVNLDHTYSCYRGHPIPCENCPACAKRKEAFA